VEVFLNAKQYLLKIKIPTTGKNVMKTSLVGGELCEVNRK
jgi:hypothetical protein